MFSVSGLPEESEAHPLAGKTYGSRKLNQHRTWQMRRPPQTSSTVRPNHVISFQNLFFNTTVFLCLLQSACDAIIILFYIDEFGS